MMLFVPHLFFLCLEKALLRDCGLPWLLFLYTFSTKLNILLCFLINNNYSVEILSILAIWNYNWIQTDYTHFHFLHGRFYSFDNISKV